MAKPRKQTYTMDMYLAKMKDLDIRSDADVQRMAGAWSKGMINELVVTVLTDDYIPPIVLGEEQNSQLWIIDGLQRSTSLRMYRYGNYKITSSIEDSIIPYKSKARDKNGNVVWKDASFDIKNKTYDKLPDELKKRFNEYQIETVIHENCNMKRISQLIKRYNNHTSMNAAQKAFTYMEDFARDIREIIDTSFFSKLGIYKENDITRGTLERIISESIMCMFHLDNWKKQTNSLCDYLNKNADKSEFAKLKSNVERLAAVITEEVKDIFTTKDSFLFLALFDRFTSLGTDDRRFIAFLQAFKDGLKEEPVDGKLFYAVDKEKGKGTKDKTVITAKLHILETLMYAFLHICQEDLKEVDGLEFVRENVNPQTNREDMELYEDCLNDLTLNVDNRTRLLEKQNHPSLVAIIAYACDKDIYIDDWFIDYFGRTGNYILNQKDNFLHMKADLDRSAQNGAKG